MSTIMFLALAALVILLLVLLWMWLGSGTTDTTTYTGIYHPYTGRKPGGTQNTYNKHDKWIR